MRTFTMTVVVMRHRVERYEVWRVVHDAQRNTREANGAVSDRVYRGDSDPNDLLIVFEWDAQERARLFVRSEDLSDALVRGGVTNQPDIWVLGEEEFAAF
jgi:hypothetical protein